MKVRLRNNWFMPTLPRKPNAIQTFSGARIAKGTHDLPDELFEVLPKSSYVLSPVSEGYGAGYVGLKGDYVEDETYDSPEEVEEKDDDDDDRDIRREDLDGPLKAMKEFQRRLAEEENSAKTAAEQAAEKVVADKKPAKGKVSRDTKEKVGS